MTSHLLNIERHSRDDQRHDHRQERNHKSWRALSQASRRKNFCDKKVLLLAAGHRFMRSAMQKIDIAIDWSALHYWFRDAEYVGQESIPIPAA
jgi:hypothetical protein